MASLPTAITLVSFTAQPNADGTVTLLWTTAAEIDNAGFNLCRATTATGSTPGSTRSSSPGRAQAGAPATATWIPARPGIYFYKLEDVDYNGVGTFHGPVEVGSRPRPRVPLLPADVPQ